MASTASLFSWSLSEEPLSSWCVNNVHMCGLNQVAGSLSDGKSSNVVTIDMCNGTKTAHWKQMPSTVVSLGYSASSSGLFAFEKEGSIWQLDTRSEPTVYPVLRDRKTDDVVLAGAVSSDEHSLAVAVSISNGLSPKNKKKKTLDQGDQQSDSDDDSVEPFTYSVQLWDVRNMSSAVHLYSQSHSEEIQALSFSEEDSFLLMSGGADGLVNVFDSRISDEDDAIMATNQMESSINRVGFVSSSRAYALTDDNCYALMKLDAPDDVNVLFRKKYSNEGRFVVDVLDCDRDDCFYLLDSTAQGKCTVQLIPNDGKKMKPVHELTGHSDLLRCAVYDVNQRVIVSGGDDGRIVGHELLPPIRGVHIAKGAHKNKHSNKPYARA